jgi:poly(A) polymerase Pap1
MKNKHSFKLIDGKFTSSEATKVLNALFSSKINYHSMEKFSNEERFGKDPANSEKRIAVLKKVNDSLKKFLDSVAQKGLSLKIDGFIEITIIE